MKTSDKSAEKTSSKNVEKPKAKELKTEGPLSEKDEVKQAEQNTQQHNKGK